MTRTDEWYTDQDVVDRAIEILNPKPQSRILCPYDSDASKFVQTLKAAGHEVIYGIRDFAENETYECDYIITNPPFSIKDTVIEQCFKYGVRSVLVLPLDSMGGKHRRKLYRQYEFPQIYVPEGRISYFDQTWIKRPASNFHSIIMTLNHGEHSKLDWE